uniref:ubiquitinyl hydrolase 1 n=1 Tax=Astyanax mexicanus TaxID=7994 RepID=A0A8B9KPL7_ASTMX
MCLVFHLPKEKFDAVELNTEEPPMVFKAQLFALTGVQPERQKVMIKGGTLKVTSHRRCYINDTIRCYFQLIVPFKLYPLTLRDLYESMDKTSSSIPPIILLQFLHMAFPQFAEKGEQGQYLQQDANECWVQVMRVLQQKLEPVEPEAPMETGDGEVINPFLFFKQNVKKIEAPKEVKYEPFSFSNDLGSNNSGYYDLQAVLTHQGRSSSSGHYVGWVKRKEDEWVKFDDDKVSVVTPEDILKLSGGGDWHIAYVLVYGPRRLEVLEEKPQQ